MADLARRVACGELPAPPVVAFIGMTFESLAPGQAVMSLEAGPQHANPMGTVHGGILCDLADAAMGMAFASELAAGETFTTLDLNIHFLKPVRAGRLLATARVVRRGRTVSLLECDLTDVRDQLVARVSSTVMTLREAAPPPGA